MTFLNRRAPSGHRVCRHLRCKEMYFHAPGGDGFAAARAGDEERRDYWCAQTCRPRGPEGAGAALDACAPDRACYEA
ncbi:MAG: hypothetical protein HY812_00340 [Planctomycetes bacterium]|nr:hypothetical protein [Planctomycetota bacterium]